MMKKRDIQTISPEASNFLDFIMNMAVEKDGVFTINDAFEGDTPRKSVVMSFNELSSANVFYTRNKVLNRRKSEVFSLNMRRCCEITVNTSPENIMGKKIFSYETPKGVFYGGFVESNDDLTLKAKKLLLATNSITTTGVVNPKNMKVLSIVGLYNTLSEKQIRAYCSKGKTREYEEILNGCEPKKTRLISLIYKPLYSIFRMNDQNFAWNPYRELHSSFKVSVL